MSTFQSSPRNEPRSSGVAIPRQNERERDAGFTQTMQPCPINSFSKRNETRRSASFQRLSNINLAPLQKKVTEGDKDTSPVFFLVKFKTDRN